MFTLNPRQEKALFAVTLVFVAVALYAAAWRSLFEPASQGVDFDMWWALAMSMVFTYQVGYRSLPKPLGPLGFVLVFVLPTLLQSIGVAIGLVRLYS